MPQSAHFFSLKSYHDLESGPRAALDTVSERMRRRQQQHAIWPCKGGWEGTFEVPRSQSEHPGGAPGRHGEMGSAALSLFRQALGSWTKGLAKVVQVI